MSEDGRTMRTALSDQAKRLYVDASYSSRGHYEEAADFARLSRVLGVPLAIVGGLSAAAAGVTALVIDEKLLTAALALLAAVLTSVHGFIRPEENAEAHGDKAGRYKAIRDDALLFLTIDLLSGASDGELIGRLKAMRADYKDLGLLKPHRVSRGAYQRARAGIEKGESSYGDDPLWKELSKS
jgi:hypothetical protein